MESLSKKLSNNNTGSDNPFKDYYKSKIRELELKIKEKELNFMRLQAQRNDINDSVVELKEELRHLLKSSHTLADVVKVLSKETVLVKTSSDSKLIVKIDKSIKVEDLKAGVRVTLKSDEKLKINRIIPSKVDPLVSLMKVEKVPDSTFDMIGGLEEQIKEIREVI